MIRSGSVLFYKMGGSMNTKNKTGKFRIIFRFLKRKYPVLCGDAIIFGAVYSM